MVAINAPRPSAVGLPRPSVCLCHTAAGKHTGARATEKRLSCVNTWLSLHVHSHLIIGREGPGYWKVSHCPKGRTGGNSCALDGGYYFQNKCNEIVCKREGEKKTNKPSKFSLCCRRQIVNLADLCLRCTCLVYLQAVIIHSAATPAQHFDSVQVFYFPLRPLA